LILWRAMNDAAAGRPVGFEHVRAALRLLDADASGSGIDAPGHRVQRIGASLVLTTEAPGAPRPRGEEAQSAANLFHYPLSLPGEVRLPGAGCVVSAAPRPAGVDVYFSSSSGDTAIAIVRSDVCRGPLAVRNRRPGDRFRPLGLQGQKKLQDFFVDRKVARQQRDLVPLVVDHQDRKSVV